MLGFVEPSYVLTRLATRPGPTNVAWRLMGEKLRLSPWRPKPERNCNRRTLYFSLILVKSLQLRGRRQIAEPRKSCLVRVIVFLALCFLYLSFLTGSKFGLNS